MHRDSLRRQIELADGLYIHLSAKTGVPDRKLMDRVLNDTKWAASDWLLGLPFDLGYRGMIDEAVSIA